MAAMDGYVRVSRVAGRKGESYISPKVQRDKITGWANLHDVELGEVVVEEDVSGAKPVDERELGMLLRRVESGQSQGIIAYKLSRFGRGALETLQAVERIREAGGRLVTVEDGVDSAKPGGRCPMLPAAGETATRCRAGSISPSCPRSWPLPVSRSSRRTASGSSPTWCPAPWSIASPAPPTRCSPSRPRRQSTRPSARSRLSCTSSPHATDPMP